MPSPCADAPPIRRPHHCEQKGKRRALRGKAKLGDAYENLEYDEKQAERHIVRTRTATTQHSSRFLQAHAKVAVMTATSTWTWRAECLEFVFSVGALLC